MEIITRNTTNQQPRVRHVVAVEAFLRQLFAKPSGQYLVTVHQGQITQVATIDRPIHIEDCVEEEPALEHAPEPEEEEPVEEATEEKVEEDPKPARKRRSSKRGEESEE